MKIVYFVLFFCISLLACKKDSTFIPDPNDNLLPKYTEKGYDIAGALLNDTAWRCEFYNCSNFCYLRNIFGISSSITGDSTVFYFLGAYTQNSIRYIDSSQNNIIKNFVFVIKGLKIETQDSLLKLNNITFQLDSINSYASITNYDMFYLLKRGKGTFTVTKVQKENYASIGDGSPNNPLIYRFILSGKFNFETYDDKFYNAKDGRFDMEVYLNQNLSIQ